MSLDRKHKQLTHFSKRSLGELTTPPARYPTLLPPSTDRKKYLKTCELSSGDEISVDRVRAHGLHVKRDNIDRRRRHVRAETAVMNADVDASSAVNAASSVNRPLRMLRQSSSSGQSWTIRNHLVNVRRATMRRKFFHWKRVRVSNIDRPRWFNINLCLLFVFTDVTRIGRCLVCRG